MPEKPFEYMRSADRSIRQQFLDTHNGREPDNFVESAEGGAVDGEQAVKEDPAEQQRLLHALESRLRELRPDVLGENEPFRWD